MSGIYGAFNRQSGPVEETSLEKMHTVFSQWFDDGTSRWLRGSVGLGHTKRLNSPDSGSVVWPAAEVKAGHDVVVTTDSRLDNVPQLARDLGLAHEHALLNEGKLLLAAYRKWGEKCVEHLLGDFCFVIWDGRRKRLFCARDHLGIRPFYYSATEQLFLFANDIEPILAAAPDSGTLSVEALANYLTYAELNHPTATFFTGIKKLPPGHTLIVTADSVDLARYWHPEGVKLRTETTENELVAEFQELLEDAISSRTASEFPVGAHLSGGLDSSVVAVSAARSLRKSGQQLHVYNWIRSPREGVPEEGVDYEVSRSIALAEGMKYHLVDFGVKDLSQQILNHDIRFNDTAQLRFEPFVRELAKSHGVRTILSGWGGDQVASYPGGYQIAAAFWHGHVLVAARELYESVLEQPVWRRPWAFFKRCVTQIILPVLPYRFHHYLIGVGFDERDYSAVLSATWRGRMRGFKPSRVVYSRLDSRLHRLQTLSDGMITARLESWAAGGMRCGIDYRYPLLDKRILEFSLGVPDEFFTRNGFRRYLFRRASTRWLKQAQAWRRDTKSEPNRIRQLVSMEKALLTLWSDRLDMTQFDVTILLDGDEIRGLLRKLSSLDVTKDHSELDDEITALILAIYLAKLPVTYDD